MKKFGKVTVKHHRLVLIIGILLLIPSFFGMIGTRINYDMLHYLPKNMDTVKVKMAAQGLEFVKPCRHSP